MPRTAGVGFEINLAILGSNFCCYQSFRAEEITKHYYFWPVWEIIGFLRV
jgi:hypothetical protein